MLPKPSYFKPPLVAGGVAFHEIAVPHRDILSRNFSSEVYAASLWDVYKGRGPDVYSDDKTFFAKTYITDNLKEILDSVRDRLAGKGGGHFRSLSTPFGGGKTHTMIALYHKCKEWKATPVVMVGTAMNPKQQTLWGTIEEQLTGRIDHLDGQEAPGSEALRNVLAMQNKPVLILIDELLQYVTKADAVTVNNTNLATLTIEFVQELSEAISTLDNVCVVVTLPSSANEQLDDERFAQLDIKLKKLASRTRDTLIPVSDDDIPRIIRRRLFSTPSTEIKRDAESIVASFVDYCEAEGLIPEGQQPSSYREEFLNSYPFLPQVINVLYRQWGSITTFQRTRGVLRLLSLVVGSLSTSDRQFITLGDFDLSNDTIKHELVEYLDPQFNSVIAKDITGSGSGASKVNQMVPDKYKGKNLGTRTAVAIFMHSHSGGAEINGGTESELKRATCEHGIPASQIGEVLTRFKDHLFYLNVSNDRYMFTKETNILKLKVDIMDNLKDHELDEAEKSLLKKKIGKTKGLKSILWPSVSRDVEDTPPLKLIIMKSDDMDLIREIHDKCGDSDRIRRNNMFFLVPNNGEKISFLESLKSRVAWDKIARDPDIKIDTSKKFAIRKELEKVDERLGMIANDYYSTLYVPEKNGLELHRLRASPVTDSGLDQIAYDHLLETEAVSQGIGVLTLQTRYLNTGAVIETSNVINTMLSVPGEIRPTSIDVLKKVMAEGVADGEFGLGHVVDGQPVVKHFKKEASPCFEPGEVILPPSLCGSMDEAARDDRGYKTTVDENLASNTDLGTAPSTEPVDTVSSLRFGFNVPEGQVNNASKILLRIESSFKDLRLEIKADDGKMTEHDIDMIKEALKQMGAKTNLL